MNPATARPLGGPSPALNILLADDHDLMRRGLKALLEARSGWSICGEARTGKEAVSMAEQFQPEVAVLDVSMPELNGLEAARQIKKVSPKTEILILSVHYSDHLIREILRAGIRGYMVKSDSDRDLINAVETLARHKPFFTSCATELILTHSRRVQTDSATSTDLVERLTPREREIVQLISEGKSSKEIATVLGISIKTAETHRANIMRKLHVHSVTDLVRYAVRNEIVQP
jgi:DNA-binding NarL/FixJ family response regulator